MRISTASMYTFHARDFGSPQPGRRMSMKTAGESRQSVSAWTDLSEMTAPFWIGRRSAPPILLRLESGAGRVGARAAERKRGRAELVHLRSPARTSHSPMQDRGFG